MNLKEQIGDKATGSGEYWGPCEGHMHSTEAQEDSKVYTCIYSLWHLVLHERSLRDSTRHGKKETAPNTENCRRMKFKKN